MNYAQYIKQFTESENGIKEQLIGRGNTDGVMPLAIKERIEWKLNCAEIGPRVSVCIYPRLTTHDIRKYLIYELHRLDCDKVFFRPGVRNLALSSKDLFDALSKLDFKDLPTTQEDPSGHIAGIATAVALLYCSYLKKSVEAKSLLNMPAGESRKTSKRAVEVATEMLNDIRHFTKERYDGMVMEWYDTTRDQPTAPSRFAY